MTGFVLRGQLAWPIVTRFSSPKGYRGMDVSVDDVDDAVFALDSARIVDNVFLMDGELDWVQSLAYLDEPVKSRRQIRALRREVGRRDLRRIRTPITIVAEGARSFRIRDNSHVGVLILDNAELGPGLLTLNGVIPCAIDITLDRVVSPYIRVGRPEIPNLTDVESSGRQPPAKMACWCVECRQRMLIY